MNPVANQAVQTTTQKNAGINSASVSKSNLSLKTSTTLQQDSAVNQQKQTEKLAENTAQSDAPAKRKTPADSAVKEKIQHPKIRHLKVNPR